MLGYNTVYLIMIFLGAVVAAVLYLVNGFVLVKDNIKNKAKAAGVFTLSVILAVPTAFLLNYLLHPIAWGDNFYNLTGLAFHTLYSIGFLFLYSSFLLHVLKLNAKNYINAAVPSVAIFTGISKIGCAVAGCCGGIVTGNVVIPTAIIESVTGFLLLVAFQFFIKTNRLSKYLIIYGSFRFLVEFLRAHTYSVMILDILKPEQLYAMIMVAVGIILTLRLRRKKDYI